MTPTFELTGLGQAVNDAIARKAANAFPSGAVSVSVVPQGRRGTDKNALIAKVQSGLKRSPWYLNRNSDQWTAIRFLANGLASADYAVRKASIDQIARFMLEAIRANVTAQRNQGGSGFKALTPQYAAYKRRKFGFIDPILKATGDLLDGLTTVVEGLR